jgi:host factor-I protein
MSEFDVGLPSVRQVQSFIKDKQEIEIKSIAGDLLAGKILWQDPHCICLLDRNEQQILVWRQALAYIKPKIGS